MTSNKRKIANHPYQIVERVAEFIAQGDLEGVVSMFHPNCRIAMDPAQEPMQGHAGVRNIFSEFVALRATLNGSVTGEMINADTALIQGHWSIENNDGAVLGGGTSTEVAVKLEHGGWVYFIDCPISVPEPNKSVV